MTPTKAGVTAVTSPNRSKEIELGYVFHSTAYANLQNILDSGALYSLPSLVHELKLTERDIHVRTRGAEHNLPVIMRNQDTGVYGGIFFSYNGIVEENYHDRFVPISFGFNLRKLLENGYVVGVSEGARDFVIFNNDPMEKTKIPLSEAEVMFFPSGIYFNHNGELIEPPTHKPYLEEYSRFALEELDRLPKRYEGYMSVAENLHKKDLYGEVARRLSQLYISTLGRARLELAKASGAEAAKDTQFELGLLEKRQGEMESDGIAGLLTLTEGQIRLMTNRMRETGNLRFRLFNWGERVSGGITPDELGSRSYEDPSDLFYRIFKDRRVPQIDYGKKISALLDSTLIKLGSEMRAVVIARNHTALVNDIALALILASPTKSFLTEKENAWRWFDESTKKFKKEFTERVTALVAQQEHPFFKMLLQEEGKPIFFNHPRIVDYLAQYCRARQGWEAYLSDSAGKGMAESKDFLLRKLRQKGAELNDNGEVVEILNHEEIGLPGKIVFVGDRGRDDLPFAIEKYLRSKGVNVPDRKYSTFIDKEERRLQGNLTT